MNPSPTSPEADPSTESTVKSFLPFDIWRVLLAILAGWKWILAGAVLGGVLAFGYGWTTFRTKYTAQVQIVRREVANTFQATELGESFKPRQFNTGTISSMMRSGRLMDKAGAKSNPPVSAGEMQARIVIRPEKNTDLITVAYTSPDSAQEAAETLNRYAELVVELTRDLQTQEASELLKFIDDQLGRTQKELSSVQDELLAFSRENGIVNAEKETESYLKQLGELDLRIESLRTERKSVEFRMSQTERELAAQSPDLQRLQDARRRLEEILSRYTDQHPLAVEQKAVVESLEEAVKLSTAPGSSPAFQSTGNTVANNLYLDLLSLKTRSQTLEAELAGLESYRDRLQERLGKMPDRSVQVQRLKSRATSLEETRTLLAGRQREARLFADQALGYYRLFAPASPEAVEVSGRAKKTILVSLAGSFALAALAALFLAARAMCDDRIISPADARRLASAPVLASLPDVAGLDENALARWRFETWSQISRTLPVSPAGSLAAAFLSASRGEGKTLWIGHLARAALERGLRVLVVSCRQDGSPPKDAAPLAEALADPARVLAHLRSGAPAEFFYGASEAWPAERLQAWKAAMQTWTAEPGLVALVELPPASDLRGLLLAESVPNLLWLCESGRGRRGEVQPLARTLKAGGLRPAAVLLNRIPDVFRRLPDLGGFGLCLLLSLALLSTPLPAQEPPPETSPPASAAPLAPVSPATPASGPGERIEPVVLSVPKQPAPDVAVPHPPLAPWQRRLELGPGDLVNLQVYGMREYTRTEVPVGPDGTISYLQVNGFKASGLTIDELREGLSKELAAYIRNARVIVTPAAWRSKKYFLLGTVMDRGAFTLDRPLTLLEATARSRGIATGLMDQNTVEIADMRRAFIVRGGQRLPVDFSKLFNEGDLSHNIALEPGDYVYFPSNIVNEVYILGHVSTPGTAGVTEGLTVTGAITGRGGFTQDAWKGKILVVRGSMTKPQTFVLDVAKIMEGKEKDMVLQPRDIVYVAQKPWNYAEEVLDLALRSFLQAATATWAGRNIEPAIKDPILPTL